MEILTTAASIICWVLCVVFLIATLSDLRWRWMVGQSWLANTSLGAITSLLLGYAALSLA